MGSYQGKHRREDQDEVDRVAQRVRRHVWALDRIASRGGLPGGVLPDPPAHRTDPRGE